MDTKNFRVFWGGKHQLYQEEKDKKKANFERTESKTIKVESLEKVEKAADKTGKSKHFPNTKGKDNFPQFARTCSNNMTPGRYNWRRHSLKNVRDMGIANCITIVKIKTRIEKTHFLSFLKQTLTEEKGLIGIESLDFDSGTPKSQPLWSSRVCGSNYSQSIFREQFVNLKRSF